MATQNARADSLSLLLFTLRSQDDLRPLHWWTFAVIALQLGGAVALAPEELVARVQGLAVVARQAQ